MSQSRKSRGTGARPPRIELVREPSAEPERARKKKSDERKEKSPGFVVNKTAEIRRVASQLVSQGKPPRPKLIKETLKAEGIEVTSAQVSMALTNTEFAYRRNQIDWQRPPVIYPEPALALGQVSVDDVLEARKFVERLGSLEKAMAALVALKQFGGEASKPSELVYASSWAGRLASAKAAGEST
jgi:hypothetical protein